MTELWEHDAWQVADAVRAGEVTATAALEESLARIVHRQPFVNLVVTNVPGPQVPLYCLGARMLEAYPMVPLSRNLSLGVAILSYCGVLHFGLFADAEVWPDLDDLAADVGAAFATLRHAVGAPADAPASPALGEGAVG